MQFVILLSLLLLFGNKEVLGFPSSQHATSHLSNEIHRGFQRATEKRLLFDPLTAPIEVTGAHSFIPPDFAAGDQRGPCPGLNSLANHGYIARNGITGLAEATAAINEVWGMGLDLGPILAIMGTVFVGDPLSLSPSFSIGGETSAVSNLLFNGLGLLGTPRGLIGSHNILESDSSITRNDLYVTGDAWTLDLSKFESWYAASNSTVGDYNMDVMAEVAATKFQETVETNPNFYFGPFTGMVARNAGFAFAGRLFANHSVENQEGVLIKDANVFQRIGIDDLLIMACIGGNTGTVNSFTGVDLANLTGGVLNAATLLENNNLMCFVLEAVKTLAPSSLSTLFSILAVPLQLVTSTIGSAVLSLSCPAFKDLTIGEQGFAEGIQAMFPGAAKSGSAF
ncbi:Dothistromin biosynthesis peroxidase dotB [Hyphodiscus hymeniophilus]|uniref:Dothistromin biosynthesis peroxidase dotB n=1 Tax=Hyphodiscus hymeniophilus TaxID=353542 RepID=A0A9P6VNG9_9HELO|nr:Dothistromin biosynthesis peroxidase dotB [Hyphodiscus hymeniophilus]